MERETYWIVPRSEVMSAVEDAAAWRVPDEPNAAAGLCFFSLAPLQAAKVRRWRAQTVF